VGFERGLLRVRAVTLAAHLAFWLAVVAIVYLIATQWGERS
jgi:hypothetical protein